MATVINQYRFASVPIIPSGMNFFEYHESESYSQADNSTINTSWTDLSGNGRHLVPTPPESGITFQTNELNGYPIIRLDGTANAYFGFVDLAAGLNGTGGYVYILHKVTNITTSGAHKFGNSGSAPHYPFSGSGTYETFGRATRSGPHTSLVDLTTWHLYYAHSLTNDWEIRQNNAVLTSNGTNTVAFSAASYLGFNGAQRMIVDIAGVWLGTGKPTSGKNLEMIDYLETKYNLVLS